MRCCSRRSSGRCCCDDGYDDVDDVDDGDVHVDGGCSSRSLTCSL